MIFFNTKSFPCKTTNCAALPEVVIPVVRLTLLIKGKSDARMSERGCGLWCCRLKNNQLFVFGLILSHDASVQVAQCRSDRSAVDRVDGGDPEKYEQNVWAVFPCGSAGGRTEGTEAASAQSLHRQREFSCNIAHYSL